MLGLSWADKEEDSDSVVELLFTSLLLDEVDEERDEPAEVSLLFRAGREGDVDVDEALMVISFIGWVVRVGSACDC